MSKNCAPELLANPRRGRVFSFAGAKVRQFRKPPKHITLFFEKKCMNTITYIIIFICRGTPARKGENIMGECGKAGRQQDGSSFASSSHHSLI